MILIIAVSFFGSKDLVSYLESLRAQTFHAWRIVIVDNSESPDEWRLIRELAHGDSRVQAMRAPKNLGYFGAVHWALQQTSYSDDRWLIVSNVDVRLAGPETLSELMLVPPKGIAVVAPSIRSTWDGKDQNPYQLTRPTIQQMNRRRWILGNPILLQLVILIYAAKGRLMRHRNNSLDPTESRFIYAAHGSFFAVSHSFLDCGGHFEFPLFLFAEELFIAEQARTYGLRTLYAPAVKVEHIEHSQTGYFRSFKMLQHGARAARYGYSLIRGGSKEPLPGAP